MPDRRYPLLAALAAVAAAALVAAYAAKGGPALAEHPVPVGPLRMASASSLRQVSLRPERGTGLPGAGLIVWAVLAGTAVLMVVLVIGLLVAIRQYLHRPSGLRVRSRVPAPAVPDAADAAADERRRLQGQVLAGLADMEQDGDPRRAIIACWLGLERAAAAAGTPRAASETPADLATRVLAAHAVRPRALAVLAGLYREARYSVHPLTSAHRDTAREALQDVHADLAGVLR